MDPRRLSRVIVMLALTSPVVASCQSAIIYVGERIYSGVVVELDTTKHLVLRSDYSDKKISFRSIDKIPDGNFINVYSREAGWINRDCLALWIRRAESEIPIDQQTITINESPDSSRSFFIRERHNLGLLVLVPLLSSVAGTEFALAYNDRRMADDLGELGLIGEQEEFKKRARRKEILGATCVVAGVVAVLFAIKTEQRELVQANVQDESISVRIKIPLAALRFKTHRE